MDKKVVGNSFDRKQKQVPQEWLFDEIENQRKVIGKILAEDNEKAKNKNLMPKLLYNLMDRAKQCHPGKYVAISEIAKFVKTGKEEEHTKIILSRNIQPVRKIFLRSGLLLSNRPGYGYRLDVKKDVVFEAIKKIESAIASVITAMVVIRSTDYKREELSQKQIEGLKLCSKVVNAMLPIMDEFSNNQVKAELMNKGHKDLQELKKYLDELLVLDKF